MLLKPEKPRFYVWKGKRSQTVSRIYQHFDGGRLDNAPEADATCIGTNLDVKQADEAL